MAGHVRTKPVSVPKRRLPQRILLPIALVSVALIYSLVLVWAFVALPDAPRKAMLWLMVPSMLCLLAATWYLAFDYDHLWARVALGANLRGITESYARSTCKGFLPLADKVRTADDDAVERAEMWVRSHRVVQRDLDRKVEVGLDLVLLLLGAIFSTAFTRAWGAPDFAPTWPTLHEALSVVVPLGVIALLAKAYVRVGRGFHADLDRMSSISREDPDRIIQSLPFRDPKFCEKFQADAIAAAVMATARRAQIDAMAHFTSGGRTPRTDEVGSTLFDVGFKFFQLGAGFILGAVIAVITG
jgi:hypothetical protein